MDWTELWLPVLVGSLLRIGVPLTLTLAAAWGLRRLDQRWQREAEARRERTGIRATPLEWVKCWVLNDCPPEMRRQCPAYLQRRVPCWQLFRDDRGRLPERCLGCPVFRKALATEFV